MVKKVLLAVILASIAGPLYAVSLLSTQPEAGKVTTQTGLTAQEYFTHVHGRFLAQVLHPNAQNIIAIGIVDNEPRVILLNSNSLDAPGNVINVINPPGPGLNIDPNTPVHIDIAIDDEGHSMSIVITPDGMPSSSYFGIEI